MKGSLFASLLWGFIAALGMNAEAFEIQNNADTIVSFEDLSGAGSIFGDYALDDLKFSGNGQSYLRKDTSRVRWESVGPDPIENVAMFGAGDLTASGRALVVAIHPDNSQMILLGTAQGGIWRSVNGGRNFAPVADNMPSLAINVIRFAPGDPNIVYAGSGEPHSKTSIFGMGVYKSADGGQTWIALPSYDVGWDFRYVAVSGLRIDPNDPDILYVTMANILPDRVQVFDPPLSAPKTGIFKSTDGGRTWRCTQYAVDYRKYMYPEWDPYRASGVGFMDIELFEANPAVLFATEMSGGIYRSIDYGEHWERVTPVKNIGGVADAGADFPAPVPKFSYINPDTFLFTDYHVLRRGKTVPEFNRIEISLAQSETGIGTDYRTMVLYAGVGAAGTLIMMSETRLFAQPTSGEEASLLKDITSQPQGDLDRFLASQEPYFREFAKTFLLDPKTTYLAAGQKGSQPIPILRRFKEGLDQIAKDPFPVYLEPSEKTRGKIARSYGAPVDEIAISRNATDALSMILHGIEWQNGDELLTSTMEYPNCVATLLRIAGRYGVKIRQFGVPMDHSATADEVVASIRRQIRPGKTKVLFFSCPIQPTGIMLPAIRIARLAQEYNIITVADGAHYGGQFVPKLAEIGIDFWGISGHKWQCGPGGTGILYVRNRPHPANSTPLPQFFLVRSGDLEAPTDGSRPAGFDIGAALSLYGFPESADWRALGEVCELWDAIGRKRIEQYILALGEYARRRFIHAFGKDALLQPLYDPELKSGIIAFNPFPKPEQRRNVKNNTEFRERMFKEYGFHVGGEGLGPKGLTRFPDPEARAFPIGCIPNRDSITNHPSPTDYPMRINACFWNHRGQIDQFVASCQELVKKMI